VEKVNSNLAHFETIKKFELLSEPFTLETGELTFTLKLRRDAIATRHASTIDRLYE
jgi:long-chain acyl-CoA synthetase